MGVPPAMADTTRWSGISLRRGLVGRGDGFQQRRLPGRRLAMAMAVRTWRARRWGRLVHDAREPQRSQGRLWERGGLLRHIRGRRTLFLLAPLETWTSSDLEPQGKSRKPRDWR